MVRAYLLACLACLGLTSVPTHPQPGVANRCVMWGGVLLQDGSRSLRFAPEPIPDGPHYLHYIVTLNGDESRILTELAPKWDPHEDGVPDGADPYPLYPIPDTIAKRTLVRDDGPVPADQWPTLHQFAAEGMSATTCAAWDEQYLYLGCRLDRPRGVFVQIDADSDGWFVGRDNYQLTGEPLAVGGDCTVRVFLVNAAEPGKWPFNDETLVKPESIRCWADSAGGYSVLLAIPRSPETGLQLEAGETIGLNVGYTHPTRPGRYLTLFEPHVLAQVKLGQ